MPGRNQQGDYRYAYQGQEKDPETGWEAFELRMYDGRVGRWMTMDPYSQYHSPYLAMGNNPVKMIDPDGGFAYWKPDSNGNLIAEKGDNAETLSKFLGVSLSEASGLLIDQKQNILSVKEGTALILNNVFTRSIKNSTSDVDLDVLLGKRETRTGPQKCDFYNCWGAAIAGVQGLEINNKVGIPFGVYFDMELGLGSYTPTTSSNAIFGKTVIRFGDDLNSFNKTSALHGAVFYGKSQDGSIYVYTKNGWSAKPEVMKLSTLLNSIPTYGKIKGLPLTKDSGYYLYTPSKKTTWRSFWTK